MAGDSENRLRDSMRILFNSQKRAFQALTNNLESGFVLDASPWLQRREG